MKLGKINLKQVATKVALQAVGGFGAVQVAKFIPATLGGEKGNPIIKAGIVCLLGGFMSTKKGMMSEIGQGMMTVGGLMLGNAFLPNQFPKIAGIGAALAEEDAYVQGYLDGGDDEAIASAEDEAELLEEIGDAEDFVAGSEEDEDEVGCVDEFTM
jgi:hypothetical protein